MKRLFDFTVQVVYTGTVKVEAENLPDAEQRVRGLVKPQGVICDSLMEDGENYEFDSHPVVHFLHHSEIPNTDTEKPLCPPVTEEALKRGAAAWCQQCKNEACCLHGTDSLASMCDNYKDKED